MGQQGICEDMCPKKEINLYKNFNDKMANKPPTLLSDNHFVIISNTDIY